MVAGSHQVPNRIPFDLELSPGVESNGIFSSRLTTHPEQNADHVVLQHEPLGHADPDAYITSIVQLIFGQTESPEPVTTQLPDTFDFVTSTTEVPASTTFIPTTERQPFSPNVGPVFPSPEPQPPSQEPPPSLQPATPSTGSGSNNARQVADALAAAFTPSPHE